ncbi:MAG: family 65 glycosyl hydrolase [Spirochaetaceae bacterium]|jgi:alpha,alpha-trehalose phosphorylase|nr:family 65 glycosyl hydrolase [Spirochaetaceae bacterium]
MRYTIPLSTNPQDLLLHETLFHNANGYLGVRAAFEEGYAPGVNSVRGAYINGFYDFAEMKQAEKLCGLIEEKQTMLNVADTQGIRLFVDDEELSLWSGTILEGERTLNMDKGWTERRVLWRSQADKEIEIVVRRTASFMRLSLFLIDYTVRAVNCSPVLRFVSSHRGDVLNYSNPDDPRVAAESVRHLMPAGVVIESIGAIKPIGAIGAIGGSASFVTSDTARSGLRVCSGVTHVLATAGNLVPQKHVSRQCGHGTETEIAVAVEQGETARLLKYCVFTDSLRVADCEAQARRELKAAVGAGPERIYREQEAYLAAFWDKALLEIEGDEALNTAVAYNLYQLLQSAGKDAHCNIAAKGLSGEGYEGHYFWDTEMYIEPFFTLTVPELSRNCIAFRYATLDEARKNARLLGHRRGALFPWRTIMGRECSGYFPSGTAQYHINGDIAWSVVSYYLATGDFAFIAEKGAEIVFECARLWLDAGSWHRGRFEIHGVTGPDEYTCLVNNNYFTNRSAQFNLRWATRFYALLKDAGRLDALAGKIGLTSTEIAAFDRAGKAMYLPYDEALDINPQDDSFLAKKKWDLAETPPEDFPLLLHYHPLHLYRHQVCKQADTVLAHVIFEGGEGGENEKTVRNSFLYYEAITTHDSSLSACVFSIAASRLGYPDKASAYFGNSALLDLADTHGNTKDGIHTANMGGVWMAIVHGFAGLRITETGPVLNPRLPERWRALRFNIACHDSRIQIAINQTAVTLTLVSGTEKTVHVYGKPYTLKDAARVEVSSKR